MNKLSWTLLIISLVLSVASAGVVLAYGDALKSTVAYQIGQSIGNGECQKSYSDAFTELSDELKEKGEISLFNKILIEKPQEEK